MDRDPRTDPQVGDCVFKDTKTGRKKRWVCFIQNNRFTEVAWRHNVSMMGVSETTSLTDWQSWARAGGVLRIGGRDQPDVDKAERQPGKRWGARLPCPLKVCDGSGIHEYGDWKRCAPGSGLRICDCVGERDCPPCPKCGAAQVQFHRPVTLCVFHGCVACHHTWQPVLDVDRDTRKPLWTPEWNRATGELLNRTGGAP